MKIKIRSITSILLILFLVIQIGYFKLLGNYIPLFADASSKPLAMFYLYSIILILLSFVFWKRNNSKALRIEVFIVILAALVGSISALFSGEVEIYEAIKQGIFYYFCLLAFPIYDLLIARWEQRKLLKWIVILTIGMYFIKAYISFYYGISGTVLYPAIGQEGAVSSYVWVRNNIMRINPPNFGSVVIPISFYLADTSKKRVEKYFYWASIIGVILYTSTIHQARSLMVYELICLLLLIVVPKINKLSSFIRVLVASIGIVILINTSYFQQFIESFSSNTLTGESFLSRFATLGYFGSRYLNSPVFGTGMLSYTHQSSVVAGHISDIGFLTSIFTYGLLIFIFLIIIFVRNFRLAFKLHRINDPRFLLIFGMTVSILLTGINIDCFSSLFAFSMPFYLAICEYVRFCLNYESYNA